MPLIRYEQGDLVTLENTRNNTCECGVEGTIITMLSGRIKNSIRLTGCEINSYLLSEVIYSVNNQLGDPIKTYEFVYSIQCKELICYILLFKEAELWFESIVVKIIAAFDFKIEMTSLIRFKVHRILDIDYNLYNKKSDILRIVE